MFQEGLVWSLVALVGPEMLFGVCPVPGLHNYGHQRCSRLNRGAQVGCLVGGLDTRGSPPNLSSTPPPPFGQLCCICGFTGLPGLLLGGVQFFTALSVPPSFLPHMCSVPLWPSLFCCFLLATNRRFNPTQERRLKLEGFAIEWNAVLLMFLHERWRL